MIKRHIKRWLCMFKTKTYGFSFLNFLPLFFQPSPTYSLPDFSPFLAGSSGWPLASPSLLRPGIQESQITSSECNKGKKFNGDQFTFRYENGEKEHCLELWNRDGKVILRA